MARGRRWDAFQGQCGATARFAPALIAVIYLLSSHATAQPSLGLEIAEEHCAMCHAIGKSGESPHRAAPPFRRLGRSYDLDRFSELLQEGKIVAGHPDMPLFKLDRNSARALTSYLRKIQEN